MVTAHYTPPNRVLETSWGWPPLPMIGLAIGFGVVAFIFSGGTLGPTVINAGVGAVLGGLLRRKLYIEMVSRAAEPYEIADHIQDMRIKNQADGRTTFNMKWGARKWVTHLQPHSDTGVVVIAAEMKPFDGVPARDAYIKFVELDRLDANAYFTRAGVDRKHWKF